MRCCVPLAPVALLCAFCLWPFLREMRAVSVQWTVTTIAAKVRVLLSIVATLLCGRSSGLLQQPRRDDLLGPQEEVCQIRRLPQKLRISDGSDIDFVQPSPDFPLYEQCQEAGGHRTDCSRSFHCTQLLR
jgi:hypothetical protein